MDEKQVSDFMDHEPIICGSSTRISEVKYLLSKYDLNELIVVDENKNPIGVVNFSDVETEEIENMMIPSDVSAGECMRKIPAVVLENSTLEESLNVIRNNFMDYVVIVDRHGHLAGLIKKETITKIVM